jgi:hypothetical protein
MLLAKDSKLSTSLKDISDNPILSRNYIPDDYEEIGHFDDKVMDGI